MRAKAGRKPLQLRMIFVSKGKISCFKVKFTKKCMPEHEHQNGYQQRSLMYFSRIIRNNHFLLKIAPDRIFNAISIFLPTNSVQGLEISPFIHQETEQNHSQHYIIMTKSFSLYCSLKKCIWGWLPCQFGIYVCFFSIFCLDCRSCRRKL